MKKPFARIFFAVLIAALAIGVWIVGLRMNAVRKKNFEQTTQSSQAAKLTEAALNEKIAVYQSALNQVTAEIKTLYGDKDKESLAENISEEKLQSISAELAALKTRSSDYGLTDEDAPEALRQIQTDKKAAEDELEMIEAKYVAQKAVDALFTKEPNSYTKKAANNVIIKEDLTQGMIDEAERDVQKVTDEDWQEIATAYISFADSQLQRAESIQASFDKAMPDGKLSESATRAGYKNLQGSIAQVRNKELKKTFTTQLKQLDTLLANSQ